MPDIDSAIENFNNAMVVQETPTTPVADVPVATPVALTEEIECPNCYTKLSANAEILYFVGFRHLFYQMALFVGGGKEYFIYCVVKGEKDDMNKDLLQEIGNELKGKTKETLLEALVNCFLQNPVDFGKNVVELMHQIKSIPDMILWNNFYLFLQEGNFDYDILRKLAVRLEESGNKQENAACIVYTLNRIDDPRKAKFISWLTLSVINRQIDFDNYFRLVKTIDNLVYADLIYLSENVENITIDSDNSHIDDFLANGLIYSIDSGFAYADKSYDIVEYGIRRGHSVRRPKEKPERQVLGISTIDDIKGMF